MIAKAKRLFNYIEHLFRYNALVLPLLYILKALNPIS